MPIKNERLDKIREEIETLRKQMVTAARDLLAEEIGKIFEQFPELDSFGWRQYTPFFNDGDTCEFSAHIDPESICINEVPYFSDENEEENYEKLLPATEMISELLEAIGEDSLEAIFGDHAEVIVRRSGEIEVEECDHD